MELDELKKSWNALNQQLQKEPIADEKQIAELIAGYKDNAHQNLGRLLGIQRFSLRMGVIALAVLFLIGVLLSYLGLSEYWENRITMLLAFLALTLAAGIWWDRKTYRWTQETRINEMSVAEVSRRMVTFSQWTRYEVTAISVWAILFNILYYWVMKFYLAPFLVQAIIIVFLLIINTLIIYTLYKKLIYKHLDNIKKNIEELKDLCTE
ncbi:MAG: hypothetical protein K2L60_07705 [Bacteroides sp.]|nr:hypothetical protein [Bacteroides sp.]